MRAPNDPDYGHNDSRQTPEVLLVYAILSRAVQDLFGSASINNSTVSEIALAKREALNFLTALRGPWAKQRATFCSLIGLEPDLLRARIIAILEGDDKPLASYYGGKELPCIDDARAMWRENQAVPLPRPRRIKRQTFEPVKPTTAKPNLGDDDMNRTERRKTVMRMLKHGPTTARELCDATGQSITTRQISGFLYHAEKEGLVQRDGDLWSLIPQTKAALPQLLVAANSG